MIQLLIQQITILQLTQQQLLIAQRQRERRATGARRGPTGGRRATPVNGNT